MQTQLGSKSRRQDAEWTYKTKFCLQRKQQEYRNLKGWISRKKRVDIIKEFDRKADDPTSTNLIRGLVYILEDFWEDLEEDEKTLIFLAKDHIRDQLAEDPNDSVTDYPEAEARSG